jgi:hypothetical protein
VAGSVTADGHPGRLRIYIFVPSIDDKHPENGQICGFTIREGSIKMDKTTTHLSLND